MKKSICVLIFIAIFLTKLIGQEFKAHQLSNSNIFSVNFDNKKLDVGLMLRSTQVVIDFYSISDLVKKYLETNNIPGTSIALVDKDGIIWSEAFGVQDTVTKTPINKETLFCIGSVTKTVTATIILKAVEMGILDLDTPIKEYIPEIKFRSRYEDFPETRITLRHLLSNHSGLTHEAPLGNNWDNIDCSFEDHIQSLNNTWLKHPVGQRNDYSSSGFDLAAYILQRKMKMSYAECAYKILFKEIGMNRTTVDRNKIIYEQNKAFGHSSRKNAPAVVSPQLGGGAVFSTAEDMAKFIQLHLNNGKVNGIQFIDSLFLNDMHNVQWKKEGQLNGYGLGLFKDYTFNNSFIDSYNFNHEGDAIGFSSIIKWFPELNIGIVILFNSRTTLKLADDIFNYLFTEMKITFNKNQIIDSIVKQSKQVAPNNEYVGSYESFKIYIKDGKSFIQFNEKDIYDLNFISQSAAYYESSSGQKNILRFCKGQKGQKDFAYSMTRGFAYNKIEEVISSGPNKTEWTKYIGQYERKRWGQVNDTISISLKNGYLWFNNTQLDEVDNGVFYMVNDSYDNHEIVIFKEDYTTYRNIRINRIQ